MDTYYCPNMKCAHGIGLSEVFKSAEQCQKCGTQTRKLSFIDMMRLVEDKKKYQSNPEPDIEETSTQDEPNQQLVELIEQIRPFPEQTAEPDQEPAQEQLVEPVSEPMPETMPNTELEPEPSESMISQSERVSLADLSDEDIRKDIDGALESLGREKYAQQASEGPDQGSDNGDSIIGDGIRVLIEQKGIMIKQNELILRSLAKLKRADC
jgi:hypothetical protein